MDQPAAQPPTPPETAERQSSKRAVEIAQMVMKMRNVQCVSGPEDYNALLRIAKTLAGSVLSQANPND